MFAAVLGHDGFRRVGIVLAMETELAVGQLIHAADDVQHGGLATAGFAQHHQQFTLIDVQINALQHAGDGVAVFEFLDDIPQG